MIPAYPSGYKLLINFRDVISTPFNPIYFIIYPSPKHVQFFFKKDSSICGKVFFPWIYLFNETVSNHNIILEGKDHTYLFIVDFQKLK